MEISILTARILGVIYLSFALGVLLNWDNYKSALLDLLDNSGYMLLAGFMATGLGISLLSVHNIWIDTWHSLITLIGWIATVKGVMLLAFPTKWSIYRPLLMIGYFKWIIILVTLLLGSVLCYFGFFA